jgi:hypothetical protein
LPAPTGEGVPKKGDRAARDTHTYPTLHASDIEEGEYTYHNPWPLAAGQAAVSNGTTLVPTDITTAAELTTHAGDADAHHSGAAIGNASGEGVTVDANGTVTVKLGDAEGVEGVNVLDADGVLVARVDSNGTATFAGSVEAGGALRAGGSLALPGYVTAERLGSGGLANGATLTLTTALAIGRLYLYSAAITWSVPGGDVVLFGFIYRDSSGERVHQVVSHASWTVALNGSHQLTFTNGTGTGALIVANLLRVY